MPDFVTYSNPNRYRVYVTWVDHGNFVKDNRTDPSLVNFSLVTGRNFHITGYRLDGTGDPFKYNVVIPQEIQGSFKVPQIGDTIYVEENTRSPGEPPIYVYSSYNDLSLSNYASSAIPEWGGIPGDYGHIRSHRDHSSQFSTKANSNFTKKFIKSVTGYRFRKYYSHVYGTKNRFLEQGKFVVRGDNVFDVRENDSIMSRAEINTEEGMDIVSIENNSLSNDFGSYPNPLNVPTKREVDENYVYISYPHEVLDKNIEGDFYLGPDNKINKKTFDRYKYKLKNKNYFSYQPIVDKKYYEYLKSIPQEKDTSPPIFEREIPAAEEYQVALRGNNKLLIQDQYGDGEQLLITLKNQYDAGFTVLHNAENSHVRVRDHLGQGVLLEGNPWSPRVVSWTTERQVIDAGSIREYDPETGETSSFGEYIYLRNGSVFGKSDTDFGRLSEKEIPRDGNDTDPVPQQEFALINSQSENNLTTMLEGISSRLSEGMNTFLDENKGNGLFFRNNYDPKKTNQLFSMVSNFDDNPTLTSTSYQEHSSAQDGKRIVTEHKQVVQDNDSDSLSSYSTFAYFNDGTNETSSQNNSINNSSYSESYSFNSYDGPAGISTFQTHDITDASQSRREEDNVFLGKSSISTVKESRIDGFSGITTNLNDLVTENSVEIVSNTLPFTRVFQIKEGINANIIEMPADYIKRTQYNPDTGDIVNVIDQNQTEINAKHYYEGQILASEMNQDTTEIVTIKYDSGGAPINKIEQIDNVIDVNRMQTGLTVNIASGDSGGGSINIGNLSDAVVINADTLTTTAASGITTVASTGNISTTASTGSISNTASVVTSSATSSVTLSAPVITSSAGTSVTLSAPVINLNGIIQTSTPGGISIQASPVTITGQFSTVTI